MNSYLANPGPREANTPANRRALRPLTSWPKGTPLPLPLPFKRGEGAASAVLVGTEVQEQGEAMHRPRSGLNSTAVLPSPLLKGGEGNGAVASEHRDACKELGRAQRRRRFGSRCLTSQVPR
jgi:hypothetical protein